MSRQNGQTLINEPSPKIPDLRGDVRSLIPVMGLRNYWYPAIPKRSIPKRHPIQVKMLGEEICFYRGANGDAVGLRDVCPHRGARLSEGTCHWKGTISCPYHGWTFDDQGKNVAVLSEGPESKICGKPGTEATVYPTQELKGIVFVWIGEEDPAPIQEDVPEEFFDPKANILYSNRAYWRTNWAVSLENYFDSHPNYLHRDDVQALFGRANLAPRATVESTNARFSGNGFLYAGRVGAAPYASGRNPNQDVYQDGLKWPKHHFRRIWAWLFIPFFSLTRVPSPPPIDSERWGKDLHLPGMARVGYSKMQGESKFRFGGGGFLGGMTRQVIAVEPDLTRLWYFHHTRPTNCLMKFWHKLLYKSFYRWAGEKNFSAQDGSVMPNQRYDTQEMLSPTDFGVVQWRKLVVTKHWGGRNAIFKEERNTSGTTPTKDDSAT